MDIKNKILKTELIHWKNAEWLQNKNLKELSSENLERIKTSIKNNNFVQPFNVWQDKKGDLWILDGHHRKLALECLEREGLKIPDKLPANFIDCKDKREAAKLVLVYSSIYAKIQVDGLKEFVELNNLDFADLAVEIDIPELNIDFLNCNPENFDEKQKEYDENIDTDNCCPKCGYKW